MRRNLTGGIIIAAALAATAPVIVAAAAPAYGGDAEPVNSQRRFRTFFVARDLGHARFREYLESARPDLVQAGNYGAMLHGYAADPGAARWPMNLPVTGEREILEYQRRLNAEIRALGLTVVGHFRFTNVLGDWDQRLGFIEWYERHWPEDLLGPRPHPDVAELLQRDADGRPLSRRRHPGRHLLYICQSSPYARQMLKRMLDVAIAQGLDGVISLYNYHYGCVCRHCNAAFGRWLAARPDADAIAARLGIAPPFEEHRFDSIPVHIPGYPRLPEDAAPADIELAWLASAWAAGNFKAAFDEIFIEYGRSVKPDLIVGTWNHLGNINIHEERAFLPIEDWGRGEDYFWYSGGAAFVDRAQNLAEGLAGDAWLAHLYIRAFSEGKPFVMGKYERVRIAMSMAEGYATGALGMGRYMDFADPTGFETLTRYTLFRKRHDDLYREAEPAAETALILPRQSVLNRRCASLEAFRQLGQALVELPLAIDVVVDQKIGDGTLARFGTVILPAAAALSDAQIGFLADYAAGGGRLLAWSAAPGALDETGRPRSPETAGVPGARMLAGGDADSAAAAVLEEMTRAGASRVDAPRTVRLSAYRRPEGLMLHLVNYDRETGAREDNRGGPADERPRAARNIAVDLHVPEGDRRPVRVRLYAPERGQPLDLDFEYSGGRLRFVIPEILVYAVAGVT